ncbi:MAG: ABC transporter ATP-binding protein [Planctomycetes bacterium]|nr:ABC transporter ATP-binding protein [Planctomycetota bacterium]
METLRFLFNEYRRNARWMVIGFVSLLLGTLCQVAAPVFIKLAIDILQGPVDAAREGPVGAFAMRLLSSNGSDAQAFINECLIWTGGLALVLGVFQFTKRYYLIRVSRKSEYELKKRMYEHLQDLPATYFDNTRSGGIMSLMTSDTEAVRMMVGPACMYLGSTLLITPMALAIMFSLNTTLTWFALLPLIGLIVSTLWFSPRVRRFSVLAQEDLEQISARAQENFAGTRVVKAFSRENFEVSEMDALGARYLKHKLAVSRNNAMFAASIWVLGGLGGLVVLFFGAREIAAGRFSQGDFAAFSLYNVQLYWPMIMLGWVTMLLVRGAASHKRITDLLNLKPDSAEVRGGEAPSEIKGRIEFRNVTVRYSKDGPLALDSASFIIEPGQTLAVVGPVGCGKTTVANLLLRLVKPDSGEILVDGTLLEAYDIKALRRFFAYVPQESFLFSETVKDNIALGLDEGAGRDELVKTVAEAAALDEEISALPSGYDTMLGERGVNLSGGQKQRAAIARALAKRPRVLVLDDCLSAVDTQTEERILGRLKQASRGLTVLLIAQRVSTVSHADRIIVLQRGRIVQQGTPDELRDQPGLYADMARRQELAEELA